MTRPEVHQAVAEAVAELEIARHKLAGLLLGACPGPHQFVQHRDRKPPWCKACGYTKRGDRMSA